jgi:carbamoyl-phosphate synthase large subunit
MESPISVLVTAVGGRSVGHQILHALKLCGAKYRIVATDADPFSYGLYETDARYIVPKATESNYADAILSLVRRERIQVVLPGSEPEVLALSRISDALREVGALLLSSDPAVIGRCADKGRLAQWLAENRFGAPRSARGGAWKQLSDATGFPIIGKPAQLSGGSRNVAILASPHEVERYIEDTAQDLNAVVFQEYVGSAESEYTVGVMVAKNGGIIDSIAIHRNLVGLSRGLSRQIGGRDYVLSTGYSQGFVVKHPALQKFCEALALAVGARGPLNIQCRLDGDSPKVLEVHPRFSGTSSIRADVGFNEPDVLIDNFLLGRQFGRIDYRSDVAVIRAFQTMVVPRATMAAVPRLCK